MSLVGRNAPCPCGSGRKHKFCCLPRARAVVDAPLAAATAGDGTSLSPRFRFEPGSYAGDDCYLPSIACLEQHAPDEWRYHFVLVIPDMILEAEQSAVARAEQHLDEAFQGAPPPAVVAARLRAFGYVSVEGFRVADTP